MALVMSGERSSGVAVRRRKFGNVPTTVDGHKFASAKEANRYCELRLLERGHQIVALVLQPRFLIEVNGQKVCTYVGDFSYMEKGRTVVEDVKGVETDVFKLKRKLMRAVHGIDVVTT